MVVDGEENVVGDTIGGNGGDGDAGHCVKDGESNGELVGGVKADVGGNSGRGDDDGGSIGGIDVDIGDGDDNGDGQPVIENAGGDAGFVDA